MPFTLPVYSPPDFSATNLAQAPLVRFEPVTRDGLAPKDYHATSVYPEYFRIQQEQWVLLHESRMDCVVVQNPDDSLEVKEFRRLRKQERVACGRGENGEDGIFVHTDGFQFPPHISEKFAFRSHLTRETSFSIDYDELYELLEFERDHGFIVWVMGPAAVFDQDSRQGFSALIESGFVHALLAGNALATHDVEGAIYGTALGQELYSKQSVTMGHYRHLDALNIVRSEGSMQNAIDGGIISDGVMKATLDKGIPYVLAGSIRDDGPLPEVQADVYRAQDQMRTLARKATTIIALATQLHAIATGNMAPSYHVLKDGSVRPVYFYSVDMSEFAVSKLANRGSLTARSILTNVQDFIVTVERGLRNRNG